MYNYRNFRHSDNGRCARYILKNINKYYSTSLQCGADGRPVQTPFCQTRRYSILRCRPGQALPPLWDDVKIPPLSGRIENAPRIISPGIRPRFLSQKIDANEPEKKMPSTATNASRRSANVDQRSEIHVRAQSTFFLAQGIVSKGIVSTASSIYFRCAGSLI